MASALEQGTLSYLIACNAFRTLGLPANASHNQVVDAGSRLRRLAKLGGQTPSPWDLDALGEAPRAERNLRNAEEKLRTAEGRLRERVFWFQDTGTGPPSLPPAPARLPAQNEAVDPVVAHDQALAALFAVDLADPAFCDKARWIVCLDDWIRVVESDGYGQALVEFDDDGDFEPPATIKNVEVARQQAMTDILGVWQRRATRALSDGEAVLCSRILSIVDDANLRADDSAQFELDVIGPLEDELICLCDDIRAECRNKIVRADDAAAANIEIVQKAIRRFDEEVEPRLTRLLGLVRPDEDVGGRLREVAADCLLELAKDWTWADDYVQASHILNRTRIWAVGTPVVNEVARLYTKISPMREMQSAEGPKQRRSTLPELAMAVGHFLLRVSDWAFLLFICGGWFLILQLGRDNGSPSQGNPVGSEAQSRPVASPLAVGRPQPANPPRTPPPDIDGMRRDLDNEKHRMAVGQTMLDRALAEQATGRRRLGDLGTQLTDIQRRLREGVPVDKAQYERTLREHNTLVQTYNRNLPVLRASEQRFENQRKDYNSRVHQYNVLVKGQ
jgi:hypothetical protein